MPALPFDVDAVPYALIMTPDGIQQIRLGRLRPNEWARLVLGAWAEFEGEKVHEHLFDATEINEP